MESLDPDDVPPARVPDDDKAPLRCEYEGCQNSLTYSGKGRRPKFCDEHKKQPGARTGVRGWSEASRIENTLATYLGVFGAGVKFVDPYDGKVIAEGAPAVAHEIVEVAKSHKNWRKPLELICSPGEYGKLAFALMTIALPIMVNHGLIPQIVLPFVGADAPPPKQQKPNIRVVNV